MNNLFMSTLKKEGVLIAAHRGVYGGNIIENTFLSSKLAFDLGADMVEIDVVKSNDGILYAFHDGEEKKRFAIDKNLKELSSEEIENLTYLNILGEYSGHKIFRLEDLLIKLKGKGLINLDRGWDYIEDMFNLVVKLNMEDQILIKAHPTDEIFNFLKNHPTKLMFMPIVWTKNDILKFINKDINMVAVEILFKKENDEIIDDKFLKELKEKNIKIWINAITLGKEEKYNLSAWRDDDLSIENPDLGWGWMIDKGVDIIQTDWPNLLKNYIKTKNNGEEI